MVLKKIVRVLKNPYKLFVFFAYKGVFERINDKTYLKLLYRGIINKKLNIKNPCDFNEKLQWLKLYNRKPEYTIMADKYAVRKYIGQTIGDDYLIPLLGVWDNPDDINFDLLPNQFVLKCNHNSGTGMCICKDKSSLDIDKTIKGLKNGMAENYYTKTREWPYKNIERKIIAETFMVDDSGDELKDYKFMCFNGKVKCIFVCTDRFKSGLKITVFDTQWDKLQIKVCNTENKTDIPKPYNFEKMIELAEKLSQRIPFVRIDFYEVNRKIYFGEITFFPESGYEVFEPEDWLKKMGEWIKLQD